MVAQIVKLSDVELLLGGEAIKFTIETTGGKGELAISTATLPLFIQFVLGLATFTENDGSLPTEIYPISVDGVGVQEGSSPDTTILLVKIGGVALPLEMPRNELVEAARRLLLAASAPAPGSKPN